MVTSYVDRYAILVVSGLVNLHTIGGTAHKAKLCVLNRRTGAMHEDGVTPCANGVLRGEADISRGVHGMRTESDSIIGIASTGMVVCERFGECDGFAIGRDGGNGDFVPASLGYELRSILI